MENFDKHADFKENKLQMPEKRLWKLIPEEPALISALSSENTVDFERYKQMDRSPETQTWMIGDEMTNEEIKEHLDSHSKEVLLYAISGEKGEGDLEGWVQFLPEEKERIDRIRKLALADLLEDDLILELSYAKYKDPDLPEERRERGLISSGVRQICYSLGLELTEQDAEVKESKRPLLKPKLKIVAYTNPVNKPSERVLEKSGFKKLGAIKYEPDDEKYDNFWMLDWDELSDFYARKDEERAKKHFLKEN